MTTEAFSIIAFGEILVDQFADGAVAGGAPFNVARHLSALGCDALLVSCIGQDDVGKVLRAEADRFGLAQGGLQLNARQPSGTVRIIEQGGSHSFEIARNVAWDYIEANVVAQRFAGYPKAQLLYSGTLALRSPTNRDSLNELIAHCGGRLFVDLNWRDGHVQPEMAWAHFSRAQLAKVSVEELRMLLTWRNIDGGSISEGARLPGTSSAVTRLLAETQLDHLFVTCGSIGAGCFDRGGRLMAWSQAPSPDLLADTVGAGDAFCSVVLLGECLGWRLSLTLDRAVSLASRLCTVRGPAPSNLGFYEQFSWANRRGEGHRKFQQRN